MRMCHVRVQRGLVPPGLDADDHILVSEVGVEAVGLAALITAAGGHHLAGRGHQLVAACGLHPGVADHQVGSPARQERVIAASGELIVGTEIPARRSACGQAPTRNPH